ncbi:MAG: hypothetical protein ABI557_06540, partial [Aureliella sp.]
SRHGRKLRVYAGTYSRCTRTTTAWTALKYGSVRAPLGCNLSAAPLPLTSVGSVLSEFTSSSAATASTP